MICSSGSREERLQVTIPNSSRGLDKVNNRGSDWSDCESVKDWSEEVELWGSN
jgi:hypothetical protein